MLYDGNDNFISGRGDGGNWGLTDNVYRGYSSVEYPDPIRWDIGPNNQKLPVYRMTKDDGSPVTPIPLPDLPNNFALPILRKDKRNPRDPLPPNDPIGPSSSPMDWSKVPGGGINFTQPIFRNRENYINDPSNWTFYHWSDVVIPEGAVVKNQKGNDGKGIKTWTGADGKTYAWYSQWGDVVDPNNTHDNTGMLFVTDKQRVPPRIPYSIIPRSPENLPPAPENPIPTRSPVIPPAPTSPPSKFRPPVGPYASPAIPILIPTPPINPPPSRPPKSGPPIYGPNPPWNPSPTPPEPTSPPMIIDIQHAKDWMDKLGDNFNLKNYFTDITERNNTYDMTIAAGNDGVLSESIRDWLKEKGVYGTVQKCLDNSGNTNIRIRISKDPSIPIPNQHPAMPSPLGGEYINDPENGWKTDVGVLGWDGDPGLTLPNPPAPTPTPTPSPFPKPPFPPRIEEPHFGYRDPSWDFPDWTPPTQEQLDKSGGLWLSPGPMTIWDQNEPSFGSNHIITTVKDKDGNLSALDNSWYQKYYQQNGSMKGFNDWLKNNYVAPVTSPTTSGWAGKIAQAPPSMSNVIPVISAPTIPSLPGKPLDKDLHQGYVPTEWDAGNGLIKSQDGVPAYKWNADKQAWYYDVNMTNGKAISPEDIKYVPASERPEWNVFIPLDDTPSTKKGWTGMLPQDPKTYASPVIPADPSAPVLGEIYDWEGDPFIPPPGGWTEGNKPQWSDTVDVKKLFEQHRDQWITNHPGENYPGIYSLPADKNVSGELFSFTPMNPAFVKQEEFREKYPNDWYMRDPDGTLTDHRTNFGYSEPTMDLSHLDRIPVNSIADPLSEDNYQPYMDSDVLKRNNMNPAIMLPEDKNVSGGLSLTEPRDYLIPEEISKMTNILPYDSSPQIMTDGTVIQAKTLPVDKNVSGGSWDPVANPNQLGPAPVDYEGIPWGPTEHPVSPSVNLTPGIFIQPPAPGDPSSWTNFASPAVASYPIPSAIKGQYGFPWQIDNTSSVDPSTGQPRVIKIIEGPGAAPQKSSFDISSSSSMKAMSGGVVGFKHRRKKMEKTIKNHRTRKNIAG